MRDIFNGAKVLITGGCGFIGSNLARKLVQLGAKVTLVDSLIPVYGNNLENIADIKDKIELNISDVRDQYSMAYLIKGKDFLFNLAGQTSHVDSMTDPYTDLDINATSQLAILESARKYNPEIRVVFASTRQLYGRPQYLPVDEKHPITPVDVNGINKLAGEWYHLLYNNVYGIPCSALRLTNTYGPGMRVKDARQTFLGIWIKNIAKGIPIKVFGDGLQLRDFNFVNDVVDAFLLAAVSEKATGKVFNLGSREVINLKDLAEKIIQIAERGTWEILPFPRERKVIDIGDYYSDFSLINKTLGWEPKISLEVGLSKTIEYYSKHGDFILGVNMIPMNAFNREPDLLIKNMVASVERVIRSGWWILGKEVEAFEKEWSLWSGCQYTVGVGNGMDALEIGLRALGIGKGDEVITTPMTAFATVLAIVRVGATPVLADIDSDTAILSIDSVRRCISKKTKAVMVVHLYGQAAPLLEFEKLCKEYTIHLIEDCAQAHGAISGKLKVGTVGSFSGWSFYPTKNLGTVGDGGALSTNNIQIVEQSKKLRNYGQSVRYYHSDIGQNSRLDELHAAILRTRLKYLHEWTNRRRCIAKLYTLGIDHTFVTPMVLPEEEQNHVHHLYVIKSKTRDSLAKYLKENNIESLIHYPVPVHHQEPFKCIQCDPLGLKNAERHAEECLSLPCNPYLTDNEIETVIDCVNSFKG